MSVAEFRRAKRRAGARWAVIGISAIACFSAIGVSDAATGSKGGTLLVVTPLDWPSADPAVARPATAAIWYATCATLMVFPDAAAPAGLIPRPEAAAGPPKISRDGRTYVFTVRRGLRFSDGSALTAGNFARALGRVLNPAMAAPGARLLPDVKRVWATGLRLHIKLAKRSGDLTTRLALPFACPVPLGFPVEPTGVNLMVGSGPYRVARFVPDSLIVLKRNRYYRGSRPHHLESVVVTMGGDIDDDIKQVEDGRADVLHVEIPSELRSGLAKRYGVNKSRLFRVRGWPDTGALVLNTSRPLFENNVRLRKAVNLALNRTEIVRQTPSGFLSRTPTDQIMPRGMPGWGDYRLYPLTGSLQRARRLAQGNLRGGKAILWTLPGSIFPVEAQVIVSNLRAIGLDVEVKIMAVDTLNAKARIPGAPYDMILAGFPLDYPDPGNALVRLLGGVNTRDPAANENYAYFDEPTYNRRMAAADRLRGSARLRAFYELDADIMRNEAPWAPLQETSAWLLVSKRVGCLKVQAVFVRDYAAMCLR
jgi:peptide/nickel transport system substrate-binding protein